MKGLNPRRLPVNAPKPIRGFEHISRYWDETRRKVVSKILPGEFYVTKNDELITTILGSCVSACIRDRVSGTGGMNHFLLPKDSTGRTDPILFSDAARYGNYAMEYMINEILKNGGRRENLEVKIVGGGSIIANMTNVGLKNIEFVKSYISTEGLDLTGEDVGGNYTRKLMYHLPTGKVSIKKLRAFHNITIMDREEQYMHKLEENPLESDIELF